MIHGLVDCLMMWDGDLLMISQGNRLLMLRTEHWNMLFLRKRVIRRFNINMSRMKINIDLQIKGIIGWKPLILVPRIIVVLKHSKY